MFDRVDLPVGILDTPDLPLPLSEQFKVLQSAGRETGDPYFGARLGRLVRIENLSAFGKWVSEAPTAAAAIDRSNRGLNRYLQTGTNLLLETDGDRARWSIEFLDPGFEGRFQNELLGVSYLIDVVRCFLGRTWTPDLVRVTGTRHGQAAVLEHIFEAPVLAGSRVPTIEFPARLLGTHKAASWALPHDDQSFSCEERQIPNTADPSSEVSAMISIAMLNSYPRIDWVARKLGLTRRTLQRRLGTHGTTFSRLLDEQLQEKAARMLQDRDRQITDIALELGYSELAHFSRAFAKWSGVSPALYRKLDARTDA
ncbi:AraC family transcriptional regulator [Breoghania sp. L-A4]|uniref:AraC family transcriptional regulator n=1 Tax=Breoghania sp. L-A4 TaxID=2304600 RepID=UPI0013C37AC2|nr:AraC family transcriptional regulator [Breoghania sp. L-A4]